MTIICSNCRRPHLTKRSRERCAEIQASLAELTAKHQRDCENLADQLIHKALWGTSPQAVEAAEILGLERERHIAQTRGVLDVAYAEAMRGKVPSVELLEMLVSDPESSEVR